MAEAPARRVTRSVSRASSASSDGVAGAAAGVATATSGHAPRFRGTEAHIISRKLVLVTQHAKQTHKLGLFDTAHDAARTYDRAALSLLGAEPAAHKLNFPAQLGLLTDLPAVPPSLDAVLEDDGECAAADDVDPEALSTLAASLHRHMNASGASTTWAPDAKLLSPLALGPAAPHRSPVADPQALLHPPLSVAAAAARAALRESASANSGPGWFNLAAPAITPDLKRDLRLLRLRGAFDPKRFYKSADTGRLPEHFAIGTVVEDASDFYSSRLSKAERKGSLAQELLCDDGVAAFRKRKSAALADAAAARGKGRRGAAKGKAAVRHVKRRGHA